MKERKRFETIGIAIVLAMLGIMAMASVVAATSTSGDVWAWGYNEYGQLGDGTTINKLTPVQVNGLTNVIGIAGGVRHTIALSSDTTLWAWGWNIAGKLGDGTSNRRLTPVQVNGLTNVIGIAGGYGHTIALRSDGTVWVWGFNGDGQLGDGTTTDRRTPIQVIGLTNIIKIASGSDHNVALRSDGTVWTWGWNAFGQLGDGTTINKLTPTQIIGLTNVIEIAGGFINTIALRSDGTVWAWGNNQYGQVGDGTTINRLTPSKVNGLTNIIKIASGSGHTIALRSDGTVWAWGPNGNGQLGDGTTTWRLTPVQVIGLTNVIEIACGDVHTTILRSDGTVWAWGNNQYGQLGDGTTINKLTPAKVNGLTNVIGIADGDVHSIAIVATPNQPPTASFIYSPTNPVTGEQIMFDASGSTDSDGKIVLYEWDWDNDGKYDESLSFPTAIFWFLGPDTYTVNLRVTDDKGSTNVVSKQITAEYSSNGKANIVLASKFGDWWNTLWFNQNHKDFKKIDEWLREKPSDNCHEFFQTVHCWQAPSGSKPLDWIKDDPKFSHIEEADIINVLNKEINHNSAPGLTYKHHVQLAVREEDIVHKAFRYGMSSYNPGVKIALGQVMPSMPAIALDVATNVVESSLLYHPELFGLYTILNGIEIVSTVNKFEELSEQLDETAYIQTLGVYFGNVYGSCGLTASDQCLEDEFNSNGLAGKLNLPPISEADKTITVSKTKEYWKQLWSQYKDHGTINGDAGLEFSSGLNDNTRNETRTQVKEVIVSALEKHINELNREKTKIFSPGELRVYDSAGNVTGMVGGQIEEGIPYSLYNEEDKSVEVFDVSGSYRYEVKGTGTGVYGLETDSLRNGTFAVFNASEIPITPDQNHRYTIDWDVLSGGEQGATLEIDLNSDGIFDRTIKTGSSLTDISYKFSIQQPINADNSSIFKLGRTVPVKISITEANNNSVLNVVAKIYTTKISDGILGTETEAESTSAANAGNQFRYDASSGQYIFNLGTASLETGTYQIRIALDDGTNKYVNIGLK